MIFARHSSAFQNHVLRRWARRRGIDLGREGYAGVALFVAPDSEPLPGAAPVLEFRVEERGPGRALWKRFKFSNFGYGVSSRSDAFTSALDLFLRLRSTPSITTRKRGRQSFGPCIHDMSNA